MKICLIMKGTMYQSFYERTIVGAPLQNLLQKISKVSNFVMQKNTMSKTKVDFPGNSSK